MDGQSDVDGDETPSLVDLGQLPEDSSLLQKTVEARRASNSGNGKVPITIVTGL